jgi:hypothetical protein
MNTYAASVSLLWTTAFRAVGISDAASEQVQTHMREPGGIFAPDQPDRRPNRHPRFAPLQRFAHIGRRW